MTEAEMKNELDVEGAKMSARVSESSVGLAEKLLDPEASFEASEAGGNVTEPASLVSEANGLGSEDTDTLPLVPEGVVPDATGFLSMLEEGGETEAPALRFLGSSIGPELDFISPEEGTHSFDQVMIQLVDAALEDVEGSGEALSGEGVAQLFCRGDVEDERVAFLLLLLAQNQPITGELVLLAVRASKDGDERVDGAILAREELARAGEVAVEQLSAGGWQQAEGSAVSRQPSAQSGSGSGSEPSAVSRQPLAQSGSEPQAASRKPQAALEVSP